MTTTFQRQANRLLADAGYEYVDTNGSAHEVWRKQGVPDIHVPGSPSGGRDAMLLRIRRAIRKGTPLTPPSGQETDMPRAKQAKEPLSAQMVRIASKQMMADADARAAARTAGEKYVRERGSGYVEEQAKWVKRCLDAHGRILGGDFKEACEALEITMPDLAIAKKQAGVVSYRQPGMPDGHATWIDYLTKLPPDAKVYTGGRGNKKKHETQPLPPPDAEHVGRRLERGGLTDEQHAAAERQMREAHIKAEEERVALLAKRDGPVASNGARTQLDAALELLREAALADTHAITPADITLLQGHRDTLLRHADDMRGMAASINAILARVQLGATPEGLPVA